jgi:hypothetical protein
MAAELRLNQFERNPLGVSKSMNPPDGIDKFVLVNCADVAIDHDLVCALHYDSALSAMEMLPQR